MCPWEFSVSPGMRGRARGPTLNVTLDTRVVSLRSLRLPKGFPPPNSVLRVELSGFHVLWGEENILFQAQLFPWEGAPLTSDLRPAWGMFSRESQRAGALQRGRVMF